MIDFEEFVPINEKFVDTTIILGKIEYKAISFVVPTYNRFDMLKRCIKSILNQERFDDYQIIISDNNPNTISDFKANPSKYDFFNNGKIVYSVNHKNIGGAKNCNQGVFIADSKYICMVHDDDILHPLHITTILNYCEDNDLYICAGDEEVNLLKGDSLDSFVKKKININQKAKEISLKNLYTNYNAPMLGSLIDREFYLSIGGICWFREVNCEDYIFTLRCAKCTKIKKINSKTYAHIVEENDSLREEIWSDIIIVKYYLRKYINDKLKRVFKFSNEILLGKDLAFFKYRYVKKFNLNLNYICTKTKTKKFIIRFYRFVFGLLYRVFNLLKK